MHPQRQLVAVAATESARSIGRLTPWLGFALAGVLISTSPVLAEPFNFTPIDVPGATQTQPMGINNSGQIVGFYWDSSFQSHGFLDENGTFTTIDVPGNSGFTEALGINNHGDIVGQYQTAVSDSGGTSFFYHGFIYDGSTFQTVDVPGQESVELTGINDNGVAAGNASSPGSFGLSFTYDGTLHTISVPGSLFTEAFGINNAGTVTGYYRAPPPGFNGFVENNGTFQTFNVGFDTEPFGINNYGVIAGYVSDSGFLYDGSTFTLLNYPGSPDTIADGINDHGQIVGAFYDPSVLGLYRGFEATPVPEPASIFLLMIAGLVTFAAERGIGRKRSIGRSQSRSGS